MNQLCRVCGEPAAGFHFGAFTCEGCKSFFGRTYNNLSSISECKNNGECVINKKNRTSCKACRLRKCLLVGMSKSGSRYGRRSNWFKIHCLLQEQQQHHQQHTPQQHMNQIKWECNDAENNNSMVVGGGAGPQGVARGLSPPPLVLPPAALWGSAFHRAAAIPFFMPAPPFRSLHHHHQPLLSPLVGPPSLSSESTPQSTPSPAPPQRQPSPPPAPQPPPQDPARCIAMLRSLGPVQDAPMDLSSRVPPPTVKPEPRDVQERIAQPPSTEFENTEREFTESRKTVTPLDLTCVKSDPHLSSFSIF